MRGRSRRASHRVDARPGRERRRRGRRLSADLAGGSPRGRCRRPCRAVGRLEDRRRQGRGQAQGQREPERRLVERAGDEGARGGLELRRRVGQRPVPTGSAPASTSQKPGASRVAAPRPPVVAPLGAPDAVDASRGRCRRARRLPARRSAPAGTAWPASAAARRRRPARRPIAASRRRSPSIGAAEPRPSPASASRRASFGRPSAAAASAAMTRATGSVLARSSARAAAAASPGADQVAGPPAGLGQVDLARPRRARRRRPASRARPGRARASRGGGACGPGRGPTVRRRESATHGRRGAGRGASCRQPQARVSRPRRWRAGATAARRRRVVGKSRAARSRTAGGIDRVDRGERLVEGQDPVVQRLLAADPRRDVAGVVHPQLEAAGEVALGLGQLVGRDELVAQPDELDQDRLDRRGQPRRVDAGRDLERAGVGVVDQAGGDVVGQPAAPRGPTGRAGCSCRRRARR